jgi:hypothetical protein
LAAAREVGRSQARENHRRPSVDASKPPPTTTRDVDDEAEDDAGRLKVEHPVHQNWIRKKDA